MSTKSPKTGRQGAVESHQLDDGAFELVVDDVAAAAPGAAASGAGASGKARASTGWGGKLLTIGGVAAVGVGAIVAVSLMFGDASTSGGDDVELDEVPSFRPYEGSGAVAAPAPAPRVRERRPKQGWEVEEQGDELLVNGEPAEADWRITENDVIGKEIDGERIIADSKGEPMSKIEAEIRARKMVQAIDESEYEFERRMRVRDAVNSRIMVPSREGIGAIELAPGVTIGAGLQKRLLKRYGNTGEVGRRAEEGEVIEDEEGYYDEEEGFYEDEVYPEEEEFLEDEEWEEPTY
ncbi:hypothetical protein DV096_01750 [Bradymonadaceae bacterium TMQ3]|nr:hypothetical protein DV096_01750 [Bradymonadaceae bacterium TMQ3]TXC77931.1 hypothetical protein FRC91_04150 [Bradymonadales bacterium TMQ1]